MSEVNASLKRAVGHWAISQVEGLHAYADNLANSNHRYPSVVVTELSHNNKSMGCGKTDYVVRDDEGSLTKAGKLKLNETSYRLTITEPSNNESNGQEIVDRILEALEEAALMTWLSADPLVLTDPASDPAHDFHLESLKPIGRQSIAPDISGEPFLYRAALTLSAFRYIYLERPVEQRLQNIHLNKESL